MVWRAVGFGGAGKGRTFFSVWFIAFLGPGGSPPGAALLGMARTVLSARVGPDCTSGWTPGGLSSRPVACQPVRRRCLRRRILLRPSSLLPFGAAQQRCSWGSADVLSAWGPPSSPPAAETPAAGRRSSIEAFLLGTRRGPTHTTIPPVGFGRFLV